MKNLVNKSETAKSEVLRYRFNTTLPVPEPELPKSFSWHYNSTCAYDFARYFQRAI